MFYKYTDPKIRRPWNRIRWPSSCRIRRERRPPLMTPPYRLRMWTWPRLSMMCWTWRASCCPPRSCCWWPTCRMVVARIRYRLALPLKWPLLRTLQTCPPLVRRRPRPRLFHLRCCNHLHICSNHHWILVMLSLRFMLIIRLGGFTRLTVVRIEKYIKIDTEKQLLRMLYLSEFKVQIVALDKFAVINL